MLPNEILYGEGVEVPPINEADATARVILLEQNLEREMAKPFKEQNSYIQSEILRAIRFWRAMANMEDVGL